MIQLNIEEKHRQQLLACIESAVRNAPNVFAATRELEPLVVLIAQAKDEPAPDA